MRHAGTAGLTNVRNNLLSLFRRVTPVLNLDDGPKDLLDLDVELLAESNLVWIQSGAGTHEHEHEHEQVTP